MATRIRLDQAYNAILTNYHSMLTDAMLPGNLLSEVKTVIRADQKRPKPLTPAIWIFPHASIQNQSMSMKEDWNLPIQLTSIVREKDPIIGYNKAFELSAKARSVILENRGLGLNYVRDTVSKSFEPGKPPEANLKNLHSHNALLITRFEVLE